MAAGSWNWDPLTQRYAAGGAADQLAQSYHQLWQRPKDTNDFQRWADSVIKGYKDRIELPDDFEVWVEVVRKQNRLEELVTAVYKRVMADKKEVIE